MMDDGPQNLTLEQFKAKLEEKLSHFYCRTEEDTIELHDAMWRHGKETYISDGEADIGIPLDMKKQPEPEKCIMVCNDDDGLLRYTLISE